MTRPLSLCCVTSLAWDTWIDATELYPFLWTQTLFLQMQESHHVTEVWHHFICLRTMCIFVSVNCLLVFLACLWTGLVFFLYIRNILYMGSISSVIDVTNIFLIWIYLVYGVHIYVHFNVFRFTSLSPWLLQYFETQLEKFSYSQITKDFMNIFFWYLYDFSFLHLHIWVIWNVSDIWDEGWIEFYLFLYGYCPSTTFAHLF